MCNAKINILKYKLEVEYLWLDQSNHSVDDVITEP